MSHELSNIDTGTPPTSTPVRDHVAQVADDFIRSTVFTRYQQPLAPHTRRRQKADLALFVVFLLEMEHQDRIGREVGGLSASLLTAHLTLFWYMVAALSNDALSWEGITFGLIEMFKQWQLSRGYSIGSINVRLSTVRKYIGLSTDAGCYPQDEYAKVRALSKLIKHKQGLNIDKEREVKRVGEKKAEPVIVTSEQIDRLIATCPDTPTGARDAFLLALLFRSILRCHEAASLTLANYNRKTGILTFYREKTNTYTTLRLEPEDYRLADRYYELCEPLNQTRNPDRRLIMGSNTKKQIAGPMSDRAITKRVNTLGRRVLGIENLSSHDGRHHGSTEYALGGTDARTLQQIGGWKNVLRPLAYVNDAKIANQNAKRGRIE